MKNTMKFIGIIVLIAVIGLSFAACGDGAGGPQTVMYSGIAGGTPYVLEITEDNYELTVFANPVKKSSGTVNSSSGGNFTLKPANSATTFTASVSGGGLVDLTGTITFTDSSSQTGPGTITPITDATETVHADLRGTWYCSAQNATFVFTANSVTVKLGSSTVATGKVLNCVSDTNTNGSTASTYPSGYMLTIQTTSGINFSSNTLFALNVAKTQFLENGDSNKGPYVKQ